MTTLTIRDAVERAGAYPHAIASFVDGNGYPMTVAGPFTADPETGAIEVGPIAAGALPAAGAEVCVTFSHVRPQPGVGYDERRYVNVWGPAELVGDRLRVVGTKAAGWDEQEVPFFEYAERSVPEAHRYFAEVGARPTLSRWWTFFLAVRLPFLTATIVPIALGGAVAAYDGRFSWGWWLLALVAGCAVHLGLNIANDLSDDVTGADAANVTPTPFSGGSRVMQYGLVSRKAMQRACVACYAVAVALGLVMVAARGPALLVIGLVGVVLSLQYTGAPLRLVYHGLGEPVTALGFGPIMTIGAYYVCAQQWSWPAIYASLPVAVLIALVLYVNQIPDRAGDAAVGKRTLIVRWSAPRVQSAYAVSTATAFLLIAAGPILGLTPWWTLVALATIPLARSVLRGMRAAYDRPYELMPSMQKNIALHFATGLAVVAGWVVATLVG